ANFVENRGQWATPAQFVAQTGALTLQLQRDAIDLGLAGDQPAAVRLSFEGASPEAMLVGQDRQGGYYNFSFGNDPARWQWQVAAYGSVLYDSLYDGVDVRVREQAGQFAYDLLLQPGANLEQVVIGADGVSGLHLADDGSLILQTPGGPL